MSQVAETAAAVSDDASYDGLRLRSVTKTFGGVAKFGAIALAMAEATS